MKVLKPKGATLTLAQATESNAFDVMENIAEKSLIGGGRITATKARAQTAARELMDEFVETFGNTVQRAEIKTVIQDSITNKQKLWTKSGSALYKKLDDLLPQTFVAKGDVLTTAQPSRIINITPLKKVATGELKKAPGALTKTINLIKSFPDQLTFQQANELRSRLFEIGDAPITKTFVKRVASKTKIFGGQVDDLMQEAGKSLPDDVLPAWNQARAYWKQGSETFNNRMVQKIARDDAEGLVDTLLRSPEPVDIRAVRKAIDNPKDWANVQGRMLQQFMKPDAETGLITGRTILKELQKKGAIGKDVLKEFFPKGEIKQFEKLARVLATTQRGQPTGIGTMAIQLTQGGTVIKAATTGALDRVGATILMSPAAFARTFTNPTIVNNIIKGSKIYRTGKEAAKFMTRLSAQMTRAGIEHEIEREEGQPSFFESLLRGRNRSAEPRTQQRQVEERQEPRLTNALKNFNIANQ